jgi:hypothetical protein
MSKFAKRLIIFVVALCVVTSSFGQSVRRILIPIAIGPSPGEFGSLWTSELWVHNEASTDRTFDADEFCVALCPPKSLASGETRQVPFSPQPPGDPGLIAYVAGADGDVTFNLRVQDLSRQAETWGTEIPAVREGDFLSGTKSLLNIPVDARFRQMLRIYTVDAGEARFRVRAFALFTDETLGTVDIALRSPSAGAQFPYKPSYSQVGDLVVLFPRTLGLVTVGLQLIPLTADVRYWAFISVTNNETQHVTTVTPQ